MQNTIHLNTAQTQNTAWVVPFDLHAYPTCTYIIMKFVNICSAFKIFQELFNSYFRKSDERPQTLYLTDDYHINAEASIPISHICDKLPSLRVI